MSDFNFLTTIKKSQISLSNKQNNNNLSNIGINTNFLPFNYPSSNNLNVFNISHSPNLPITSFNLFEPNNINLNNIPNLTQSLNANNNHHNIIKNAFHNMMPQFELNQCILKTQINNNSLFEKDKENTDILLTFKIRRYDDTFKTVKIFCEINKLDIN